MTLFIDDREPTQIIGHLQKLIGADQVQVQRIGSGDYVIGDKIAIERKELWDVLGSVYDGRYWKQVKVLCDTYEKPFVIVEGDIKSATHPLKMDKRVLSVGLSDGDKNMLRSTQIATTLGWHIPIFRTLDYEDTALCIAEIYERVEGKKKGEKPPPAVKKALTPKEIRENMLCCIQGVGPKTSKKILDRFSFMDLCEWKSDYPSLDLIKLVGLDKAKLLVEVF